MKKALLFSVALCVSSVIAKTPISMYKNGKVVYNSDILPDSIVFEDLSNNWYKESAKGFLTSQQYMDAIRNTITNEIPQADTITNEAGTVESITYYSNLALKKKPADVLLPQNYNTRKKYPVLYINHGIYCTEKTLQEECYKIRTMYNNLVKKGEAKEMIIVFTSVYTNPVSDRCLGYTIEQLRHYDDFREDLINCLMPYINSHYSTYTDREHTAISGFSMGAREALYTGITRPFYFGYIACACPAAGVVPGEDALLTHPGIMRSEDLRFNVGEPTPYVFLVTGGTKDPTVEQNPKKYHQVLDANNVDHLWQEIQGGKHDETSITPMYYNFLKSIFKNASDFDSK